MMVCTRERGSLIHAMVADICQFLKKGDLLVLNEARVDPVRVIWRDEKEKAQELILLKCRSDLSESSRWEAIVSGKKLKCGSSFALPKGRQFTLLNRAEQGVAEIEIDSPASLVRSWLLEVGKMPLPPYIRKERLRHDEPEDQEMDSVRYQTVYANRPGAVAAPTAGLHFSPELISDIDAAGIQIANIYLAVGWGTFAALTDQNWQTGRLYKEEFEISTQAVAKILSTKKKGGRVIAVGTTVVRALESWHRVGRPVGFTGACDLFIRPPWPFGVIDGLLTNFHLSDSSLLTLVSAFLGFEGEKRILEIYATAIQEKYQFYSYGDCMLIL
jgi:S-adenosylmethionine:tRNA ribosyltransferase-isomerase